MKTNGWIFFAMCIMMLIACDDDDDKIVPPQAVENAFQAQYPTASSVEWERAGVFRKVDFVMNGKKHEAWYTTSGVWLQTEYSENYANIPTVIKDYLTANVEYPLTSWMPQNTVEVLERQNYSNWYGVELEQGEHDVTMWSDEEAFSHFTSVEDMDRDDTPQAIRSYLSQNESNSWITETYKLPNGSYVVNVLSGSMVKQFHFNSSMTWEYTEWPIQSSQLPDAVKTVLQGTAYANYSVKSATYQERSDAAYYHIVLENTNDPDALTMSVNIDAEGNIIA